MNMKKIFSILSAGLLIAFSVACTQVEKYTVETGKSVAPVLGKTTVGTDIVAAYTPATFFLHGEQVNPKLVTNTLAIVKIDDTPVNVVLPAKDDQEKNQVKITGANLSKTLLGMAFPVNTSLNMSLAVRSMLSGSANTGYLESEPFEVSWVITENTGPDPYAGWDESTWGVTGAIESAGLNWDNDIEMVTDGTWHVAKSVVLTTTDEFKFRKDHAWTENFGGTFAAVDEEFEVTQGGPNIKVLEDGTYDLFLDPENGLAKLIVSGSNAGPSMPEIDLTGLEENADMAGAETWGVIGTATADGWDADQDMEKVSDDPEIWCVSGISMTEGKFKFRGNDTWGAYDIGGGVVTLDAAIQLSAKGGDMDIEEGTYTIYLWPTYLICYITQ